MAPSVMMCPFGIGDCKVTGGYRFAKNRKYRRSRYVLDVNISRCNSDNNCTYQMKLATSGDSARRARTVKQVEELLMMTRKCRGKMLWTAY
jgi:hypothetical protein